MAPKTANSDSKNTNTKNSGTWQQEVVDENDGRKHDVMYRP
jgi:hypothetical protein